jgi:dihydrofolate synthase/folylpolyglutamate synthase
MLRHQSALAVPAVALAEGIASANWPARLQRLQPGPLVGAREVWLDGGHNASAARQVAGFCRRRCTDGKPLRLVFASLTSKDPAGMLRPFRGIAQQVHCVPIADHACFAPDDLARLAQELGLAADAHVSVQDALAHVPGDARALIFGSLYLAGEVLAANGQPPD